MKKGSSPRPRLFVLVIIIFIIFVVVYERNIARVFCVRAPTTMTARRGETCRVLSVIALENSLTASRHPPSRSPFDMRDIRHLLTWSEPVPRGGGTGARLDGGYDRVYTITAPSGW
jgi:hypothetical protein